MKKNIFLLLVFLLMVAGVLKAQSIYYLYLQADGNEPFSVSVNNTTYHADKNGYIILSKLRKGNLFLKVAFPMNKYPVHHFAIDVQNDFGFLLKPIDNTNWQLESLQGWGNIKSGELFGLSHPSATQTPATPVTNNVPLKLSDSVNVGADKQHIKQSATASVNTTQAAATKTSNGAIVKEKEFMAQEGLLQQYIDASGTAKDTIQLLILNNAKPDAPQPILKKTTYDKPCTIASQDDFLRARLRMAAATTEQGMLDAAKEWFLLYCFSTEQVKNLSVMFLNEANRIRFFAIALPRIYDANNVKGLQSQLSDPVFIQQFKLLLQ